MTLNIKNILLIHLFLVSGSFVEILSAADFECVSSVSRINVAKNQRCITDSFVYQVNNRYGEHYTDFSIYYSKISKITNVKVWIEDVKGNRIRDLKKNEIKDQSYISGYTLYQDDRIKSFQVKHNTYPYRICYTYTCIESQFPQIADWRPIYTIDYPIGESKLSVTIPKDYPVTHYVNNVLRVKTDTLPDKIVTEYLVKGDNIKDAIRGNNLFNVDWPRVIMTPLHFRFGVDGSSESWETFGDWYDLLNKGLTKLPEAEKARVAVLLQGMTDTMEIVKTLYQYLQDNTRYININIGIGGLKSFPASYVAFNKYGDCKALTNYMKALLEYKGIKSYFVLINSGQYAEKMVETIPCSQFNHVLLAVPISKDTFWIENTTSVQPFGYVGSFTQNRKALLISRGHSHLVSMPSLKRSEVLSIRKMDVTVDEKGEADLSAIFFNKGRAYEYLNSIKHYCSENDKNTFINFYIPFDSYELKNWKFREYQRDSARIDLTLRMYVYRLGRVIGNDLYIKTFPIQTGLKDLPIPANMSASLAFPVCNIDSAIYHVPDTYKLKYMPESIHLNSNFGDFLFTFTMKGENICVNKKIELYQREYTASDYELFYAFMKSIKESENTNIICLTKN
ncbi:MAG: DUF3857 domain-containing protein [Bacteroidales bacterium]|nr:DUF3857 domain-containing protein [Bacteroidales bacterium]